ncbi:MAG: hypothetical protein Q8R38_04595 [Candidatus Omnitrophota bacterium]|nr:hypothetical protein [Candidatus Omnitrophota bacterium]
MISAIIKKTFIVLLLSCVLAVSCVWAGSISIISVKVEIGTAAPKTQAAYDNLWHNNDFVIILTASNGVGGIAGTYYKVNNGTVQNVNVVGQPMISTEGANNTLEYWSVDRTGNEELPHNTLAGIKLDKSAPSVKIVSPSDEVSFSEGTIIIDGMVSDTVSGIKNIEVQVEGDIYNPVIQPNGSFSISNVNILGGQNKITVSADDEAGNEGTDSVNVFLGWMLHLKVPYYDMTENHYSGAACCQIVLNYIRNGVARELMQGDIYDYGHPYNWTENAAILEMDPRAIDYALGHFDPYDKNDPTGQGDAYAAYNFSVDIFENSAVNNYLRDIIHWMAYPVTIDKWWLNGSLAMWPNTPVVTPAYGTYSHWIVVNGAVTSQDPIPEPHTRPWYTPNFTVYGLWLTDPVSGGIGRDLYVTAQTAQDTYLRPLVTSDRYNGKYLHVAEPPEAESEAEIDVSPPKINDETRKIIAMAEDINTNIPNDLPALEKRMMNAKKHIYDAALVVNLKSRVRDVSKDCDYSVDPISIFNAGEKPIEIDWEKVIDSAILTDEKFKSAFDGAQARSFIKVRRSDKENCFYYLVPFDKYVDGQFLTYAAIIIDSQDGSFKEASWVEVPSRFVQINREKAIGLLTLKYPNLRNEELCSELVWEPGKISNSAFYPYWKIVSKGNIYIVTQDGEVTEGV